MQSKVPLPKGKLHGVDPNPSVHKSSQFTVMMPSEDAKPKVRFLLAFDDLVASHKLLPQPLSTVLFRLEIALF